MVGSATRRGSLDGAIRGHSANDLAALAASLPACAQSASTAASRPRWACRSWPAATGSLAFPSALQQPGFHPPYELKLAAWMQLADHL